MPTYTYDPRFFAEFNKLGPALRLLFLTAVAELVDDFKSGRTPRPSLRVKRVTAFEGIWEMTWAVDGRATFEYGEELSPGQPHIIWRRIGTHDIFRNP